MAAMQMLHCTIHHESLCCQREDQSGLIDMGFFTEMFVRPRPREERFRAAMTILNAMTPADRADIGIKPADFPRIARQMSLR